MSYNFLILAFIYIWIWISRGTCWQSLITFYHLFSPTTPCSISPEVLWILHQYFVFGILFVCLCVCFFVCGPCLCVHICVKVYMDARGQFWISFFRNVTNCILRHYFSLACNLLYGQAAWLQSQKSACFHISHTRITTGQYHTKFFMKVQGHELRSLCL